MAKKRERKWIMFSLNEGIKLEDSHKQVLRNINERMGYNVKVFLPMQTKVVSSKEVKVSIFDGYVFVQDDGSKDFENRALNTKGSYVKEVLKMSSRISYVTNKEILRYKEELDKMVYSYTPVVGDLVEGAEGVFKKMVGRVISVNTEKKTADVLFKMNTREVQAKDLTFVAIALKD